MKRVLVIALALIMTFTFTVPFAFMTDAEEPAYAFYVFDSYKDLIQGLTDSSSVSFSTLMTDCTTVCKDTLTAFAKGEIKIRIPTINGEPAPLRNKDGFSNITFFTSELYDLPWTWYHCKVGEYDLRIKISYLDALDNEQLREAVSYTDVLDIIAPDAPSPSNYQDYESYKSIYEKDLSLDNGKTVKAMICELKESNNIYVMIHIDGVLMILYGDNSLLADSFFESFDLVAAEGAIKGDVNMDGSFDSLDYVLLKRVYFGTYPEEKLNCTRGDLNGNREIDSMDYVLLKRAYFGTYEIDAPEFITPDDNPILADFTFSLTWNCYGESSYDSQTGKLVKTTHTYKTNPDDYVTYYRLSNDEKQYIYNLITELDINSYPDIYDPQEGQLMSEPPMTLILSVDCNGTQKTIKAENIACEFTSKDEKGQDFLAVCKAIINTLTATEEWKALPDYEFYYD